MKVIQLATPHIAQRTPGERSGTNKTTPVARWHMPTLTLNVTHHTLAVHKNDTTSRDE